MPVPPPPPVVVNARDWFEAFPGIISTLVALFAAINAYWARYHAKQATEVAAKDREETKQAVEVAKRVSGQITTLEININHRLEELIKAEGAKGLAQGIAQGIAQEQARQSIKEVAHAAGVAETKAEEKK